MKRALAVSAVAVGLLGGSVAVAAPSQAYGPSAKQVAQTLGCKHFKAGKSKSDPPRPKTAGTCRHKGHTYSITAYDSYTKAQITLGVIKAISDGFKYPMSIGYGRTWLITESKDYTVPAPMRKAIKRHGGKVADFGRK